jgi:hypothetical protein
MPFSPEFSPGLGVSDRHPPHCRPFTVASVPGARWNRAVQTRILTRVDWDADIQRGLGIALNEATLLGAEIDRNRRVAAITVAVLSLPEVGAPPKDRRFQLLLFPVGAVVTSLREGRWNDRGAPPTPFALEELLGVVQSFGGSPIYGWDFFDMPAERRAHWADRISLQADLGDDGRSHHIELFQEGWGPRPRHLDVVIWFDELVVRTPSGTPVPISEFIAGGRRWWDGFFAHDPRTQGRGMASLGPGWTPPREWPERP